MEFGTYYIYLLGFKIYEPSVILSNFLIFLITCYYFNKLIKLKYSYAKQMGIFIFLMGLSSCFASVGHAVQHQNGVLFFRIFLFISHALTLGSVYFCFRAPYTLYLEGKSANTYLRIGVISILCILLVFSTISGTFLLMKISAGIVLIYSLILHYQAYKKNIVGAGIVVTGILVSFLSIIVHSIRLSFNDDWFNHKDVAHIVVAVALCIICNGAIKLSEKNPGKLIDGE